MYKCTIEIDESINVENSKNQKQTKKEMRITTNQMNNKTKEIVLKIYNYLL